MTTEPHKRRWFQFRLRTLLIVTAVVALAIWLCNAGVWMQQRHRFLEGHIAPLRFVYPDEKPATAPWPLWLLGEKGVAKFQVYFDNPLANAPSIGLKQVRKLFPEAIIEVIADNGDSGSYIYIWMPGEAWGPRRG